MFIASKKLFSFITPWNSLRRWIPNSFHFSLFNKHTVSIWKPFFPTDPWPKPMAKAWRHMATPHRSEPSQTHNHRSPPPLPICNHQFEPRSNPQPLISTYTTTYLSPSLSFQTKSNPYRWWTTNWERERERRFTQIFIFVLGFILKERRKRLENDFFEELF